MYFAHGIVGAERVVQRVLGQELLPFRRLRDLPEHFGVERHLLGLHGRGHVDHARHLVLVDRQALFLAGRDVAPGQRRGDLVLVLHPLLREHAQRLDLAGTPLRDVLVRIVDVGTDVLAGQLRGRLAAALERHVRELRAVGLVDQLVERLVGVLGLRAAHDVLGRLGLDRVEVGRGAVERRVGRHPDEEFVQRHHGHRLQLRVLVRHLQHQRQQVRVVRAEHDLVRIARSRRPRPRSPRPRRRRTCWSR